MADQVIYTVLTEHYVAGLKKGGVEVHKLA